MLTSVSAVHSDSTSLRQRSTDAARRAFLDAAQQLVSEKGIDALTIKALSDRLDCSVGALYRHFPSKGALLAAMQAEAISELTDAHDRAMPVIAGALDGEEPSVVALGTLLAFGDMVAAARQLYASEFELQQQLLSAAPLGIDAAESATVVPVATGFLLRPVDRIATAQDRGWLRTGNAFERAVRWVAALGGVLRLDALDHANAPSLDPTSLARELTEDLLAGWGADPLDLARAAEIITPAVAHAALATTVRPDRRGPR